METYRRDKLVDSAIGYLRNLIVERRKVFVCGENITFIVGGIFESPEITANISDFPYIKKIEKLWFKFPFFLIIAIDLMS